MPGLFQSQENMKSCKFKQNAYQGKHGFKSKLYPVFWSKEGFMCVKV